MNIRDHVLKSKIEGMTVKFDAVSGESGARFFGPDEPREGEFILFRNLGYNNEIGYFDMEKFSDWKSDCTNENPETLHYANYSEGWRPLVWFDSGGNPNMLGEISEAADVYQMLKSFFEKGEIQDDVDEEEVEFGGIYWLQMSDAAFFAYKTNPDRFPDPKDDQLKDTIREAASKNRIEKRISVSNKVYYKRESVEEWASRDEQRGRPRNQVLEVIEVISQPIIKTWRDDPATEKQIARLQSFGEDVPEGLTKGTASDLIDKLKKADQVQCWECGCMVDRSKATWDGHDWYCGC